MTKTMQVKEAPISKRMSAYLIDILLVFLIIGLISEIRFINPEYDKYTAYYEEYNDLLESYNDKEISEEEFNETYNKNYYYVSKYSVSYNIVIVLVILLYFGVFQKFNNGQTIGKRIMKIRVVDKELEKKVSIWKYLLRIIPMYYVYIGGLLPVMINSFLVYILNESNYINITLIISYIFLGIAIGSFIIMNIRKDKRGLQDIISNTKVIYEEK